MLNWIQSMDWSILRWIHTTLDCGFLDFLMVKLTLLGEDGAVWLCAAGLLLCSKKYRRQGTVLLFALAACFLVGNVFLKNLISRPRPCWLDTSVRLLIASPTDYSFPSGHALSSAAAATILTLTKRKFGYVAIPLACLITFSRLYLFVHFPSDVLGGALLGVLVGLLSVFFVKKLTAHIAMKRMGHPNV